MTKASELFKARAKVLGVTVNTHAILLELSSCITDCFLPHPLAKESLPSFCEIEACRSSLKFPDAISKKFLSFFSCRKMGSSSPPCGNRRPTARQPPVRESNFAASLELFKIQYKHHSLLLSLPHCHTATLLHCHIATLSHCQTITLPLYNSATSRL